MSVLLPFMSFYHYLFDKKISKRILKISFYATILFILLIIIVPKLDIKAVEQVPILSPISMGIAACLYS